MLFLTTPFSDELARLRKSCPWPLGQAFSPHITVARIRHPQRFAIEKKKIMKVFKDVEIALPVTLLRLYAEVNGQKQTPLIDFILSGA